jgi:hypothetical protein
MEETIEIMSDPDLMEAIREGDEDIRAGRTMSLEDFEKELARDASTRTRRPRRKTTKVAAARYTRSLARRA